MRVAPADSAIGSGFESDQDRSAPGFDDSNAEAVGFGDGDRRDDRRRFERGVGEFSEQSAAKAERLEDLAEADLYAGGDVAGIFCNNLRCYCVVGWPGVGDAEVLGDA